MRYSFAQKVQDILIYKRGKITRAQLPKGSPTWEEFRHMTWGQVEQGARANKPGFKVVRKLLTDRRFDQ